MKIVLNSYSKIACRLALIASYCISIIACSSFDGEAQNSEFFKANGNKINTETFEKEVNKMIDDMGVPGLSLAVIDNNEIVYHNGFGVTMEGRGKVDNETVFDGCSLSKTLLLYTAMQLVDEGKLDLDKPMHEYLPMPSLEHDPRYKSITTRMILSHSSGLENWRYQNDKDLFEIVADPGTKFVYSGEGYIYLSKIVEDMLGQSYEEYTAARVIEPLGLKNTFMKYIMSEDTIQQWTPSNTAIGHSLSGLRFLHANTTVNPAGDNHFTAEDYAKLLLAFFNREAISEERIEDILDPRVSINNSQVYYAPGFEISTVDGDVIISHGGDKDGFKNMMFYSPQKKTGFVFMTNIDWGRAMTSHLNKLTVNLNISPFLQSRYENHDQYPSISASLLKIADEKGYDAFFEEVDKRIDQGEMSLETLNSMSFILLWYGDNYTKTEQLLKKTIELYPNSVLTKALFGEYHLSRQEYYASYEYFSDARNQGFDLWDITDDLKKVEEGKADVDRRRALLVKIEEDRETTIQAENYNEWGGLVKQVDITDDGISQQGLGEFDTENWVGYQTEIDRAADYALTLRVTSPDGESKLELRLGDEVLTTMTVSQTENWEDYTSLSSKVSLPHGSQTLKLVVVEGNCIVNWLKLSPKDQGE
ncbi:MAG: hypothetical protein Roseis2KO_30670 [Roseivirga sp.]